MRKFRVNGIDRDSGFQTSIVIEAIDQDHAEGVAVGRGIAVQHVESLDADLDAVGFERLQQAVAGQDRRVLPPSLAPPTPQSPVFVMPPREYWRKFQWNVAQGVVTGLILWSLLVFCLSFCLFITGVSAVLGW